MPICQVDRKRLRKQIDMAEQYQKIRHLGHCCDNADCVTHCTTFGLSDSVCTEHRSDCAVAHTSHCVDCMNVICTLDEISQNIGKIADKDSQLETLFDFDNASEHVIEWSRHNLRAARQDMEKKRIIAQMKDDEAFGTFDWAQKVLPQEYREAQRQYFGKTGMSVFVGSFVWKAGQQQSPTTADSSATYSTASYIVALDSAAQTELDSLSVGEIVTRQFVVDYPHIKKLHKRTDNATNFSSHSTPECEKVICNRVNRLSQRVLFFFSFFLLDYIITRA